MAAGTRRLNLPFVVLAYDLAGSFPTADCWRN